MSKIKDIINLIKSKWSLISRSQKFSLIAIFTLLLVLPASIGGVLTVQSLRSNADEPFPVTPPTTLPTPTPDIVYSKTYIRNFNGQDILSTDWNWSGSNGSNATLENEKLKLSVSSGHDEVGGNDVVAIILDQGYIPYLVGDFDVSIDLYPVNSENGYSELKFVSGGSISIRRSKTGVSEFLEVWLSQDNTPGTSVATVRRSLPNTGEFLRVKMKRVGKEYLIYYWNQSTFVNILDAEYTYLTNEGMLPTMRVENIGPGYPATDASFDNYTAYVNIRVLPTATATPVATPTFSATPRATATATPAPCIRQSQTVSLSPSSQTGLPGSSLRYTITVKNNDSSTCRRTTYQLYPSALENGWSYKLSNTTLQLDPGKTGTAQIIFTSPATIEIDKYKTYYVGIYVRSVTTGNAIFGQAAYRLIQVLP